MKQSRASRRVIEFAVLESRRLMCGVDIPGDAFGSLGTYPAISNVAAATSTSTGVAAAGAPLTSVPALHSNPNAAAKLYLDFVGAAATTWGTYSVPATPAYDQDGDPSTFSSGELSSINQIWQRVAEKYSPFNIDVTTVDPGNYANRVAQRE